MVYAKRPFGRLAPLQRGVRMEDRRIAIVCESELFPEHAAGAAPRTNDPEELIRDLRELSQGAPVVHEDHGAGRAHECRRR